MNSSLIRLALFSTFDGILNFEYRIFINLAHFDYSDAEFKLLILVFA